MNTSDKPAAARRSATLFHATLLSAFGFLPASAGEDKAIGGGHGSAVVVVDGCEISGTFEQKDGGLIAGRWSPLRAVITIKNPQGEARSLAFFCQILSQNSKSPEDVFVFTEGTYEMAIAPGEVIVRDFPFIDLMASMPSGYMKDTLSIRVGKTAFKRYGERIPAKPGEKVEAGDGPVTIAVRAERGAKAKPAAPAAPAGAAGKKSLDAASKELMEWYAAQPGNAHRGDAKLSVSEYQIDGLWEKMGMQLFRLGRGAFHSSNFLYSDGKLRSLEIPTHGGAGLLRGVVHKNALYLTSDWGSGIMRTALYRTHRDKAGELRTDELGVISSVGGRFDREFLKDETVKAIMASLRPLKRGKAVRVTP